jgi:hypothetical protein
MKTGMDLCEGEGAGCVSTGAARVATHELWTDFLGTCAAAFSAVDGACALVHYDESSPRMRERATRCARSMPPGVWLVQSGTRCTTADAACLAALRDAGVDARRGGRGAFARVAPY